MNSVHNSDLNFNPIRGRLLTFPDGGSEMTVSRVIPSCREDNKVFKAKRGESEHREENILRSLRRSKSNVRKRVRYQSATHMLTISTRGFVDYQLMVLAVGRFLRSVRVRYGTHYTGVWEPHKSGQLHAHVAVTIEKYPGFLPLSELRWMHQEWALCRAKVGIELGGTVHVRDYRFRNGTNVPWDASIRARMIARYLSKYMTKGDMDSLRGKMLNKRLVLSSQGLNMKIVVEFFSNVSHLLSWFEETCGSVVADFFDDNGDLIWITSG